MDYGFIADKAMRQEFYEILNHSLLYPVYQAIVSLEDGTVFGYEALSRISKERSTMNISTLFAVAEDEKKVWELENLCRRVSLEKAGNLKKDTKLFLNVDPKVIHDEEFKAGLTNEILAQNNLRPDDIVIEITEKSSVEDAETFRQTIQHYKKEGFKIAIDDYGEGYSGINRICAVMPEYIKLDMAIVRDIDKDTIKQTMVENMVDMCNKIKIKLLAEGIETEEELKELIRLGVSYGQGYFLQYPGKTMSDISMECKEIISNYYKWSKANSYEPSFFGNVGMICKKNVTTILSTPASNLYEHIIHNPTITEICVLNENEVVRGIFTKQYLLQIFGGRYGFNLNAKKRAEDLMKTDFLSVDINTSIETASKMALLRSSESIYDAVVVTKEGRYAGVITIKDLLETAISIQVTRAKDASPLTGLPGNKTINKFLQDFGSHKKTFTVIYIDMDNFKAYNDAYGFHNGDLMIQRVAECMQLCCRNNEFMGHIGGDDFVIISESWEVEGLCRDIIFQFKKSIENLYSKADWEKGSIVSLNRSGIKESFPIVTLSIAGITNRYHVFNNLEMVSKDIAQLKKECKKVPGNYYKII